MTHSDGRDAELKPCPFCGYAAMVSGNPTDKNDPAINIHCSDCDAEGGWFRGDGCEKRAVALWNARAAALTSPADNPSRDDLAQTLNDNRRARRGYSPQSIKYCKEAERNALLSDADALIASGFRLAANPPDIDSMNDKRAKEDKKLASNVREATIRECAEKSLEMRNAIDMIEGALMGLGDLVDLPARWGEPRMGDHVRPLLDVNASQVYRVCDALSECTRIINSDKYDPATFSPTPTQDKPK